MADIKPETVICPECEQTVYRVKGRVGMHTRRAGGTAMKPLTELCPGSK